MSCLFPRAVDSAEMASSAIDESVGAFGSASGILAIDVRTVASGREGKQSRWRLH